MLNNSAENPVQDDVQSRIGQWLQEEGWQLAQETRPEFRFIIIADDGAGRKLTISQHSQKLDRVTIQAGVAIPDEQAKKIMALPRKKRQDFLWDLRFELLATDVEFSGLSEPLGRITLGQPIFYDALSKDLFMERLSEVKKALLLVVWKVARLMEEPPPQMGFIKG